MAPTPEDDDHYEGGAPLDGGASPADLSTGDKHFSPTGLEIGVITGVVALVIITLVGLFVWRSRKNRNAKGTGPATAAGEDANHSRTDAINIFETSTPPNNGRGRGRDRDGYRDGDRAATIKTDDSSIEHNAPPSPPTPQRPPMKWSQWVASRRTEKRDHGML
ncbi:hypothetical protein GGR54DRAFT_608470 [Hypoxylon sp. NC1633]|nr:hypothetical protein GGR54DRAFT_608470 [Hypoxylon sp. NC1633]